MNTATIKELRARAQRIAPAVRIGKLGLSESVIAEIRRHLKKKGVIKVRVLPSALGEKDKDAFLDALVRKSGGVLVHKVGFVVVLAKPLKAKKA